jgi:hypothetical protein
VTYVTLDDSVAFRATTILPERWNGWLNPLFDRDAVDALRYWINASTAQYAEDDGCVTLEWDGDTLVVTEYVDERYRIEPNSDGLYAVGCYGWTWHHA